MVEYVNPRRWRWITIASIFLTISPAYSGEGHISLIDYQKGEQLLSVNIVAPVTGEAKLYLSSDGIVSELRRFNRVGEYKLVIHLPCSEFRGGDYLLYKAGEVTLSLPLEHISCTTDINQLQQPRIIYSNVGCIIEPKGTTLWRVGSLLAEKNGYSVYQNMYAVFLSNRHHFVDEDITRMQDNLLLCPSEETIATLDKHHVAEMFKEAEAFRLASQGQKAASPNNEPARSMDQAEGSEPLAQVTAVSADIAPAEEVAGQEADAGMLAMASAAIDVTDNGLAADASAGADEQIEGGELLAQLIAPPEAVSAELASAEEITGHEADAGQLAMASAALDASEKGAEGEIPIEDTSLAAISGDAAAAAPKLMIAIDGGKQAVQRQTLLGCYIEPNDKTLWRIGVALNKLNGHSVYQNMYAVFAVNPEAFPSGKVNHMRNQKLRCPTAREVTSHTIKESQHLLEQYQ
jgi:hypothetical protein